MVIWKQRRNAKHQGRSVLEVIRTQIYCRNLCSVMSNSDTPQFILGSGSQPTKWQKPLFNAIFHLSSETHFLLCVDHLGYDLPSYVSTYISVTKMLWRNTLACRFTLYRQKWPWKMTQQCTDPPQRQKDGKKKKSHLTDFSASFLITCHLLCYRLVSGCGTCSTKWDTHWIALCSPPAPPGELSTGEGLFDLNTYLLHFCSLMWYSSLWFVVRLNSSAITT